MERLSPVETATDSGSPPGLGPGTDELRRPGVVARCGRHHVGTNRCRPGPRIAPLCEEVLVFVGVDRRHQLGVRCSQPGLDVSPVVILGSPMFRLESSPQRQGRPRSADVDHVIPEATIELVSKATIIEVSCHDPSIRSPLDDYFRNRRAPLRAILERGSIEASSLPAATSTCSSTHSSAHSSTAGESQ